MTKANLTRRAALLGAVSAPLAAASACVTSPASAADTRMDLLRDYIAGLATVDATATFSDTVLQLRIADDLEAIFPECRVPRSKKAKEIPGIADALAQCDIKGAFLIPSDVHVA